MHTRFSDTLNGFERIKIARINLEYEDDGKTVSQGNDDLVTKLTVKFDVWKQRMVAADQVLGLPVNRICQYQPAIPIINRDY